MLCTSATRQLPDPCPPSATNPNALCAAPPAPPPTCCTQHAIHVHHTLIMLFPLFGAAGLALLLPPILYLGFASEFASLHPLWPPHYLFLARRLLRALSSSGQLKVGWRVSLQGSGPSRVEWQGQESSARDAAHLHPLRAPCHISCWHLALQVSAKEL